MTRSFCAKDGLDHNEDSSIGNNRRRAFDAALWWRGVVVSREDAGRDKQLSVFKSVGGEVDGVREGSRA
jgi:hypothetical protein